MESNAPPNFWERLATLHLHCDVWLETGHAPDESGAMRLGWKVRLVPLVSADATEFIEVHHPSVTAAVQEAMDRADAKGWTE